jgi:hypothetical protein
MKAAVPDLWVSSSMVSGGNEVVGNEGGTKRIRSVKSVSKNEDLPHES